MGSCEPRRFGEEDATGLKTNPEGIPNNPNMNDTQEEEHLCHENDSGVCETSWGFGRSSLAECLDRMGMQPNTTVPATRASGERNEDTPSQHESAQEPPRVEHHLRPELSTKCKEEKHWHQKPRGKNKMSRKNTDHLVWEKGRRPNQIKLHNCHRSGPLT